MATNNAINNINIIPNFKSGYYYSAPLSALYTAALGDGVLQAEWFAVNKAITLDRIGLEVTTIGSTGSVIRLGIYNTDNSGFPSTLVLDAGTIVSTTTGFKQITISQTLSPALYCLCACAQGTPTTDPIVRMGNSLNQLPQPTGVTYFRAVFSNYGISGALPSNFTGTPGIDSGDQPFIQVRIV